MTAALHRHIRIARYTLDSLRRRWQKNLAVTAMYGLVIFLLASVVFVTQSLTRESVATLSSSPEIMVQSLSAGRHGLTPTTEIARLAGITGVQAARARLWAYYSDAATGETLLLQVPDGERLRSNEVLAGEALLRHWGLHAGTEVYLQSHAGVPLVLRIAGVAETATPLASAALLQVSEATFRALTGMPAGYAMDLVLRVRNPRELGVVAAKIAEAHPGARPIIRDELVRTYASVFQWRSGVIIAVLLVPVLAFILFAWEKAAGLSPDERRELGILKAIGWETSDVLLLKGYEAMGVSLAAFVLGAGMAVVSLAVPAPLAALSALLGWSTRYPPFRPAAAVGAYQVATLFCLAVFPYLAATIIPAWRAATTDPDLVMRS
jgi:ABC-type lipoprotein release transport system permease subunit